eukprot:3410140-Karenia_brevis.AAC.1
MLKVWAVEFAQDEDTGYAPPLRAKLARGGVDNGLPWLALAQAGRDLPGLCGLFTEKVAV